MTTRVLAAGGASALDPLIASYAFKPFRNYRALSRRRQEEVLRSEIASALDGDGFGVWSGPEGAAAAALVRPVGWDSGFFGVPMGRITHVLREADTPAGCVREVVDDAIAGARARGIRHLSIRVDVADADSIQVLEDAGFRMMDALATYIYHPRRPAPPPVKEMGVLRKFRPEDTPQVIEITREAYQGFRGRYHLDPHLPSGRADDLYVEWARKCCVGEWADVMLVTENGSGGLHGWLSYRRLEPVSSIGGTPIFGGGLGACRRDRPGAYAGLIRAGTIMAHALGAVAECQTQIFNFPTIRVYEAVGTQFVRADYTLHAWLGE